MLTEPPPACPVAKTTAPLESPAPPGTVAVTRITRDAPGTSTSEDRDTVPNGRVFATEAPNCTRPVVPPAAAASLKITAVQVPGAGCSTCAAPYPPLPRGSESAASRCAGPTRMNLTRAAGLAVWDAAAGQAIDASSRASWRGTVKRTVA